MTTNDKNEPTPFDAPLNMWEATADNALKAAKDVQTLSEDLLKIPPKISAENLIDSTFIIVALKEFESSFIGQDHAYFVGALNEDGEMFTTVLGGAVLVETLDALIAAGNTDPIRVTLREKKQGKYGRYYIFE